MDPCPDSSGSMSENEDEDERDQQKSLEPEDYANHDSDVNGGALESDRHGQPDLPSNHDEDNEDQKDENNPGNSEPIQHEENLTGDVAQLENYKKEIYKHPLYPLLALLMEKCEIATATLGINDEPFASGETFNSELEAAIASQAGDDGIVLGKNPEVDSLMIKSIQVLRIHLLELEKVQELCKDFCCRYISCLRAKMNSENLLRGTTSLHESFDNSSCSLSSSGDCSSGPSNFSSNEPTISSVPTDFPTAIAQDLSKSNSLQQQYKLPSQISEEKGKDSDKDRPSENQEDLVTNKPLNLTYRVDSGTEGDLSDEASNVTPKRNQKRGILPKQATSVMRSWLFQHIVHPYPTEDEKRAIAAQTNLTLLQVNNWFINARRRILQPMLDSANINNSKLTSNDINLDLTNMHQTTSKDTPNPMKKFKPSNGAKNLPKYWPDPATTTNNPNNRVGNSTKGKSSLKHPS